jgi:hypothetical protein
VADFRFRFSLGDMRLLSSISDRNPGMLRETQEQSKSGETMAEFGAPVKANAADNWTFGNRSVKFDSSVKD